MIVDVRNWHLIQFIRKILHVHHIYNRKLQRMLHYKLIVIGHAHGLEEAWILVLIGHPHQFPGLALHSNVNPNGFLYPMPNPPTQPCCTLHQHFYHANCTYSSTSISSLPRFKEAMSLANSCVDNSFSISFRFIIYGKTNNPLYRYGILLYVDMESPDYFIWYGIHLSPHLRLQIIWCLTSGTIFPES